MEQANSKQQLTYEQMLDKLNHMYEERDDLNERVAQLQYDIEFLETMIMYRYNKEQKKSKQ